MTLERQNKNENMKSVIKPYTQNKARRGSQESPRQQNENAEIISGRGSVESPQQSDKSLKDEVDYLSAAFKDLSTQNAGRNKKQLNNLVKAKKDQKRIDRLQKQLKNLRKNNKKILAEAQMFSNFGVPVVHKIQAEQFDVIEKLVGKIDKIDSAISEYMPKTKEEMEKFASDTIRGVAVQTAGDSYNSIVQMVKEAVASLLNKVTSGDKEFYLVVFSVALLLALKYNGVTFSKIMIVAGVLGAVLVAMNWGHMSQFVFDLATRFWQDYSEREPEDEMANAQMVDQDSLVDLVGSVLMVYMFPKKNIGVNSFAAFLKNFGSIHRTLEGTVTLVLKIVQFLLDTAASYFGFESYSVLTSSIPKVDKWVLESRNFMTAYSKGEKPKNRATYDEVLTLEDRAYEILSVFARTKQSSTIGTMVRPVSSGLSRIRVGLEEAGVCQGKTRQPPLVIMLRGMSQIGKSRAIRPVVIGLLAGILPPAELAKVKSDYDSHVYSRMTEHEFWDGYYGQTVCVFDEFNITNKAHLSATNSNMEAIRAGNVFPYVLHMAGIEQKGNVYFRSKIIICTSNTQTVADGAKDTVSYPQAVVNRFHFEMEVRLFDKFADSRVKDAWDEKYWILDRSKLGGDYHFNWEVHRLIEWKQEPVLASENTFHYVEGKTYTLSQFLAVCILKYGELVKEGVAILEDDETAFEMGTHIRKQLEFVAGIDPNLKKRLDEEMKDGPKAQMDAGEGSSKGKKNSVYSYADYEDSMKLENTFHLNTALMHLTTENGPVLHRMLRGCWVLKGEFDVLTELKKIYPEKSMFEFGDIDLVGAKYILARTPDFISVGLDYFELQRGANLIGPLIQKNEQIDKTYKEIAISCLFYLKHATVSFVERLREWIMSLWNAEVALQVARWAWMEISMALQIAFISSMAFVVMIFVQVGVLKLVGWVFDIEFFEESEEMKKEQKEYAEFKKERATKKKKASAQLADPAVLDIANKIWSKNYYDIRFDGKHVAWGMFVKENYLHICKHYITTWKEKNYGNYLLTLVHVGSGEEFEFPIRDFFAAEIIGPDSALVRLSSMRNHADITNLIADKSVLEKRTTGDAIVFRSVKGIVERDYMKFSVVHDFKYRSPTNKVLAIPVALEYELATKEGDCGLPIFIRDPTTRSQKLIGFHVAGTGTHGTASPFEAEIHLVGAAKAEINASSFPKTMRVVGEVERGTGTSGKSAIAKSPLYEAWGPAKKEIAHLKPFKNAEGERVDPVEVGLKRYDRPILTYDETLLKACVNSAMSKIVKAGVKPPYGPMRKISMEEAMFGIPGDPFMEGSNRSTSAGWDWNIKPRTGYKGKERFHGKGPDPDKSGPDYEKLVERVLEAEEKMKRGERPMFYYADASKDETLPKEKVEAGRTRPFCPDAYEEWILFKMYFARFFQCMMIYRLNNECAVGINPYSEEWEVLKRKLCKFGLENIIAGDFRFFDASQSAQILRAIGEAIIELFEDRENDGIRRIIWMNVWNSFHITGRYVVEWLQSLPSGHGGTTLINCIFSMVVFRMAFVKIHNDDILCLRDYDKSVSPIHYGDDNALGVSSIAKDKVNQHTLTAAFAKLGLEYTSETKMDNPPEFRSIHEIEFLKRSFRFEPRYGRYCAPLRLETILEMPYWTKKELYNEVTMTNVENAIRELALHPKEVFDEWCPKICEASRRVLNFQPAIIDRDILLDELSKTEVIYS